MKRLKLIGPPGTGKTERLKEIVKEKLAEGYGIDEICYTSFTNAAANEAAERVCADLGLQDRPEWFRTEHSCCFRLLALDPQYTFSRKWMRQFSKVYPAYRYSWQETYTQEHILAEFEGRFTTESMLKTVGDYCEFFYGLSRNLMASPTTVWNRYSPRVDLPSEMNAGTFIQYCQRRDHFKDHYNLHDFADMIERVIEKEIVPHEIRILICDEAQDMSPLQWRLVETWSKHVDEFYVAGDYLQSVYGFQGATPEEFLNMKAEEEVLSHSYRLTPQVKGYSQRIAEMTRLPYPQFEPCEREGTVKRMSFHSVDWLNLPETFVLCRTRYLIHTVREHLMERLIPFKCERGPDNPMNTSAGYAFRAILKLQQNRLLTTQEIQAVAKHTTKPFVAYGTKTHLKKLLHGEYSKRQLWLLGFTEEFFKHLNEPDTILCKEFELEERRYLSRVYERHGLDVKPNITLTTMHGSKGREAEMVLLNPDMTRTTWETFCQSPVEETLLQYVAATRARTTLGVLVPRESRSFPLPRMEQ